MLIKRCKVEGIKVVTTDDDSNIDDNKTRTILKKAAKEVTIKAAKEVTTKVGQEIDNYQVFVEKLEN